MLRRPLIPFVVAALSVAGCDRARPVADGASAPGDAIDAALAACTSCHGDLANGNAAPPRSVRGFSDTAQLAVGAHQTHLRGGANRSPIACGECHLVPATATDPGHMDGSRAEVVFGTLATSKGTAAQWDRTSATCTTYCHGATLPGGRATKPVWTRVDGSQATCDACHGFPPPATTGHPAARSDAAACAACHPATVTPDGRIDLAGGKHIDGNVDLGATGCTSCHGDPATASAAPPRGTKGETATTTRAVGAHQRHLAGGAAHGPVACAECHVVPGDTSHVNRSIDLTWGPLATSGGASPVWNGASCASTYCHGGTLAAGGSNTAPTWTKVDGTQAACGTCHGIPPPPESGHPAASGAGSCAACHPGVKPDGTIDLAAATHLDGKVDVRNLGCTSCHGDATRATNPAAPPKGTKGETATTARAVGAHQTHLTVGPLRVAINCSECHVVPTSPSHSNGTVAVTFGALANTGTTSSWSGTTCSTYCHGKTLTGGSRTTPTWTTVNGTQATCGSCHGIAPSTGQHGLDEHRSAGCGACHPGYTSSSVTTSSHVNGKVDTGNQLKSYDPATGNCVGCHGSANWWHGD